MVNTSFFDDELLNTVTAKNKRRASSFDLILFKIPYWIKLGVKESVTTTLTCLVILLGLDDKSFSTVPSNWYSATTTTSAWPCLGIYNYTTCSPEIIATQTFDNGNENIAFDVYYRNK